VPDKIHNIILYPPSFPNMVILVPKVNCATYFLSYVAKFGVNIPGSSG